MVCFRLHLKAYLRGTLDVALSQCSDFANGSCPHSPDLNLLLQSSCSGLVSDYVHGLVDLLGCLWCSAEDCDGCSTALGELLRSTSDNISARWDELPLNRDPFLQPDQCTDQMRMRHDEDK